LLKCTFAGTKEVDSLALKLDLFSVGDEELFVAAIVFNFAGLGYFVLSLVIDQDSWRSNS
jgi:hypothetical protein